MEYADGGDLASLIRKHKDDEQPFTETHAMTIFSQSLLALQYIHSKQILHRFLAEMLKRLYNICTFFASMISFCLPLHSWWYLRSWGDIKSQNIFMMKAGDAKIGLHWLDFFVVLCLLATSHCHHPFFLVLVKLKQQRVEPQAKRRFWHLKGDRGHDCCKWHCCRRPSEQWFAMSGKLTSAAANCCDECDCITLQWKIQGWNAAVLCARDMWRQAVQLEDRYLVNGSCPLRDAFPSAAICCVKCGSIDYEDCQCGASSVASRV